MKNLLKLPVLLLAAMLVASCGDSKKEEEKKLSPVEQAAADGQRVGCEWTCEMVAAEEAMDMAAGQKLDSEAKELEAKYGRNGSASDEEKVAFEKALEGAESNCKCLDNLRSESK